jgi:hypothetical protein
MHKIVRKCEFALGYYWITKYIHKIVSKCDYAHWYLHHKMYSWNYKLMWLFQTFCISNPSLAHILNTLSSFKPTIVFHCEFGIPSKGPSSHKLTILYNNQAKSKFMKKNCFERYSIRLRWSLKSYGMYYKCKKTK